MVSVGNYIPIHVPNVIVDVMQYGVETVGLEVRREKFIIFVLVGMMSCLHQVLLMM